MLSVYFFASLVRDDLVVNERCLMAAGRCCLKLSACCNETEIKQFKNSFKTVLLQFHFNCADSLTVRKIKKPNTFSHHEGRTVETDRQ